MHLCLYLIWFYLSKFSMWSVFTTYIIHNYLIWFYLSKFSMWSRHILYTTISYASISFLCGHDIYYIQLFHMQVTILIILSQYIFCLSSLFFHFDSSDYILSVVMGMAPFVMCRCRFFNVIDEAEHIVYVVRSFAQ